MKEYLPEGFCFNTQRGFDADFVRRAYEQHIYLEARPRLCDSEHNLHFDLGGVSAVMPRIQCAKGIADGTVKDIAIISRVNKPTGFYVTGFSEDAHGGFSATLSRLERQLECEKNYISALECGDVIDAVITRLESFGAFCDIGAGIIALLPVDSISVSRIPSPFARFRNGQKIKAVVRSIDSEGRILLSHKELLGTWEQNAALYNVGETVTGTVRSVENYGIFVELTPNLAGLAEYNERAEAGQSASVYIKSINPEKMKIKLIIVDTQPMSCELPPIKYYIESGHIDYWQYSPDCAYRLTATSFTNQGEM